MNNSREIYTDCTLCYHSCGTRVTIEDGKAVKIRGLESHPINSGRLCPKGANALDVIYSPDRLKQPLKKINGNFEPVSWDQALDEIAEKLNRLKAEHRLVDENTASAAEIFVAALRDNHRAVIIGDRTFGKARIQTIFPLKNSSIGACITTAGYLPPGNKDFNAIGITPDISIKNAVSDIEKPLCITDLISNDNTVLKTALMMLANLCAP